MGCSSLPASGLDVDPWWLLWCPSRVRICVLFWLIAHQHWLPFVNSWFLRCDPARSCVWVWATAGFAFGLKSMCWHLTISIWSMSSRERKSDTVCSRFVWFGDPVSINRLSFFFFFFLLLCHILFPIILAYFSVSLWSKLCMPLSASGGSLLVWFHDLFFVR